MMAGNRTAIRPRGDHILHLLRLGDPPPVCGLNQTPQGHTTDESAAVLHLLLLLRRKKLQGMN
jgi:hypothetical protein